MQLLKKRGLRSALYALLAVLLAAVFLLCAACASEDAGGGTSEEGTEQGDGSDEGSGSDEGDGTEETPTSIDQSTAEDTAVMTFTELDETVILDDYAVNGLDKEIDYLLKLDADRLLAGFYLNSSLGSNGHSMYTGGWEGALIGGHTMGHYLTALSQAIANAGTPESDREALTTKLNYIIDELAKCQNNPGAGAKDGFLWGAQVLDSSNVEIQFDNVEQNRAEIFTQAWVPWYTMHKILAGLLDAYTLAGSTQALSVAENLGDWVYDRVSQWSEETQATVLAIEYGGMNDALYNLYAATGEEKYAEAAHMFDEETLFDQVLAAGENYLDGKHANTTIPKIIGALNRYVTLHGRTLSDGTTVDASRYLEVAEAFWTCVTERHTYVTGGNSEWEHFGADYVLDAERTNCNCETCNTYNMLKLSRTLFTITGDVKYLDYYEGTYYNAIWSSQNPETGMTTYFQPMASGYFKVYSTEETNFWCCTGSGMESFTKLNDSIYYDAGNAVYVALYLSSAYETDSVSLTQTADLENSDTATIKVNSGSAVLRLRRPAWSASFAVYVNDVPVAGEAKDGFVSVDVRAGDTVRVELEKTVTAYNLPDGENVYAFKYGPFVLSAELGTSNMSSGTTGVNVTVPSSAADTEQQEIAEEGLSVADFMANINDYMKVNGDGTFTLTGTTSETPLTFSYHFRQYTQRYAIYNEFVSLGNKVTLADAVEWTATDTVQPGYGQYESDALHELQDDGSVGATGVSGLSTTRYATAGGSFSYTMAVEKDTANRLVVCLAAADNGKSLKITAGGEVLYSDTLNYTGAGTMYSMELEIPDPVIAAATEKTVNGTAYDVITVSFESAVSGEDSARVCSFLYSEAFQNYQAYFVDCGDYQPSTVSDGDYLGVYNSVTEQVYGTDPATGKSWGIVDDYSTNIAGTPAAGTGIGTNSTWAYEYLTANTDYGKTETQRYTKNQYENGVARNLHYKFELPNGDYIVEVYFADPWGCSKNPTLTVNGAVALENADVGKAVQTEVITVTDGQMTLDFTSSDLCINIAYIRILFA